MLSMQNRIQAVIDAQQRRPSGVIGRLIGAQMMRQHTVETDWTLSLLAVEPTDQVLEIGFGAGRAIELVAARATNGYIAGIDVSRTMVDAASRRNQHAVNAGRVDLRNGDVTTLPFSEQRFDKIFSIHTLYFWQDFPRAIAELHRVLKPHGKLVLTFTPGKVGAVGQTGLGQFATRVDSELLPEMKQIGFTGAVVTQGPVSRQFKIAAVTGTR